MLRRFLYLDTTALGQYVSALEGGATTESTKRSMRSGAGEGGVDARVAHLSRQRSQEEEDTRTFADTDEARFDRLLRASSSSPEAAEALGWIEVLEPETDFVGIGIGAMVAWECDIYIPEIIQAMANSGEALKIIGQMQDLMPAAESLGFDTSGLPKGKELEAASKFIKGVDAQLLVVGEDEDTDWRIAGQLTGQFLHGDVEGRARVVGKVSKILPQGRWKPYLTLPGMNILPRERRRQLERQAPEPGKEDQYLSGPAIMLDILAIYR